MMMICREYVENSEGASRSRTFLEPNLGRSMDTGQQELKECTCLPGTNN